ncbi:MAG: hypothetical protein OEM52_11265 [bacterium]|nr:hypothetical protein [bacterium]
MSELSFFDGSGEKVEIGKELGRGGEGAVYELKDDTRQLVAKIYHEPLKKEKQEKLLAMVGNQSPDLVNVSAWPIQTLHTKKKGPVTGFLMGKAVGYDPLHHLYTPSNRKNVFPNASWAFLAHAARNAAASIAVIHSHGHVVGDINQGNIFVSKNAVIKLIDCDSFQIKSDGGNYLCGVGVGHFIPPELQDLDLTNLVRTPNHDNFGLAILVFHLLMMGRHPYSGIYSRMNDVTLEQAIKEHWYVYAPQASKRGLQRPTNSLGTGVLSDELNALFLRAFAPEGVEPNARPTAKEWAIELEKFEKSLTQCLKVPIHKYHGEKSRCPWCEADMEKIVFFVDTSLPTLDTTFNFKNVRKQVAEIRTPGPAPDIKVTKTFTPKPMPPTLIRAKRMTYLQRVGIGIGLLALAYYWPYGLFLGLPIGIWLAYLPVDKKNEYAIRELAYKSANRTYTDLAIEYKRDAGDSRFLAQLTIINTFLFDYRDLNNWMDRTKDEFKHHGKLRALQRYLSSFSLIDADLPEVPERQRVVLESFGVETALDVEWAKVYNIKGTTSVMATALLDWRNKLEEQFVYEERDQLEKEDELAYMQAYYNYRRQLESSITTSVQELIDLKADILTKRESMFEQVTEALNQREQLKLDLDFCKKF